MCIDKNCALDDLPLSEWKEICPVFEEDIYEAISLKTCVNRRNTVGAPGPEAIAREIAENRKFLSECK